MTKQVYKCRSCGEDFLARVADRKRGWATFCSKSCKAVEQEGRTHQYRDYKERVENKEIDYEGAGWDAHKNY